MTSDAAHSGYSVPDWTSHSFVKMIILTPGAQEVLVPGADHTRLKFYLIFLMYFANMANSLNSLQKQYKHDVNSVLKFSCVKFGTISKNIMFSDSFVDSIQT